MFVCAGGRSLPSHVIPVTTAAVVLTCLGFASVVGLSDSLPFVFLENSFFLSTSLHIHFGPSHLPASVSALPVFTCPLSGCILARGGNLARHQGHWP